ncbi:MAG: glycosyltransferase family 4 protein [Pseudomonadota bacterium]
MPIKVLFLNSSVSGGGAGKALVTMVSGLDRSKIEPHVVIPFDGVVGGGLRKTGAIVHYHRDLAERFGKTSLPLPGILRTESLERLSNILLFGKIARDLLPLVRNLGIDLVYANHMIHTPVAIGLGRFARKPVIVHSREVLTGVAGSLFRWMASFPDVKKIVAISNLSARNYETLHKTRVIPDAIDLDSYRPPIEPLLRKEFGIGSDQKIVGFLGRIIEQKGVPVLLEAFARISREDDKAVLVVIGGNDPSLRSDLLGQYRVMARKLGIDERAFLIGFRENPRPYAIEFDVAVLPSIHPEGFGLVVAEAMALGVPPLVSENCGAAEFLKDEQNGMLFRSGDADDLAAKLRTLLGNDDRRKQMAQAAQKTAFEVFSSKRLGTDITSAIEDVLQGR